jgi:hypothetical protein
LSTGSICLKCLLSLHPSMWWAYIHPLGAPLKCASCEKPFLTSQIKLVVRLWLFRCWLRNVDSVVIRPYICASRSLWIPSRPLLHHEGRECMKSFL